MNSSIWATNANIEAAGCGYPDLPGYERPLGAKLSDALPFKQKTKAGLASAFLVMIYFILFCTALSEPRLALRLALFGSAFIIPQIKKCYNIYWDDSVGNSIYFPTAYEIRYLNDI